MLIAIISDTHREYVSINKVIDIIKNCDYIIHLGDNVEDAIYIKDSVKGEVIYVKGNCDYIRAIPAEEVIDIEGLKIFATHGHKYGVKGSLDGLEYRAKELGADIALYGHTHIANIERKDNLWIINPGSTSLPRGGRRSIAFIEKNDETIYPYIYEI